jgi:ethanolaminephosphotransferase
MTQGSGQSFLDAWLNVMHSADARRLVGEDTWLSRFKSERAPEKKMIYYGIDMWCMLYPEIWDRYETVDSFYLPMSSNLLNKTSLYVTLTYQRYEGINIRARQG